MNAHIDCKTADGATLQEFSKILALRVKYMHQTARQSIIATAITVLKSVRAVTKVVKPNKIKVELKADGSLYPSFSGNAKFPCIRYRGSNERYKGKEKLCLAEGRMSFKDAQVYRWTFNTLKGPRHFIIIAESQGEARRAAKKIIERRLKHYKGLARRAISVLMMKTSDMNVNDNGVNAKTQSKAMQSTQTREVIAKSKDGDGGKYLLYVADTLRYALDAVQGGKNAVDVAMKRALNGITAQISKRIKTVDFLGRKMTLPTPFPEVKGKRK